MSAEVTNRGDRFLSREHMGRRRRRSAPTSDIRKASIPGCPRIRRTVFPVEGFHAIGARLQLQIDVRIRLLIACRPVADHEEDGIILGEIQKMMAVARSSWK